MIQCIGLSNQCKLQSPENCFSGQRPFSKRAVHSLLVKDSEWLSRIAATALYYDKSYKSCKSQGQKTKFPDYKNKQTKKPQTTKKQLNVGEELQILTFTRNKGLF